MGCTFNYYQDTQQNQQNQQTKSSFTPSTAHPVPFGHVSYIPTPADGMGPLWGYNLEWWYYVGWATDVTGTKKFTILLQIIRTGPKTTMLIGIGYDAKFITHLIPGSGQFPNASTTSWSISFNDGETAKMTCMLMPNSGVLGLPGASYVVNASAKDIAASFTLEDTFGMVMEGGSGAFQSKASGERSLEFAMPSVTIKSGSITISGEKIDLARGSLWLDRETIGFTESVSIDCLGPLYVGNWLGINMNDHTVYAMVFIWPPAKKGEKQWKVGSELEPPVYPLSKVGLEYPSLPEWDGGPQSLAANGVNVLGQDEFDLNILDAGDPENSPHWTSSTPAGHGNTYCTAWRLMIKGKVYNMKAVVPESEVLFGTYAFEGATSIYNISDGKEVGHAFIEQMGYN